MASSTEPEVRCAVDLRPGEFVRLAGTDDNFTKLVAVEPFVSRILNGMTWLGFSHTDPDAGITVADDSEWEVIR